MIQPFQFDRTWDIYIFVFGTENLFEKYNSMKSKSVRNLKKRFEC